MKKNLLIALFAIFAVFDIGFKTSKTNNNVKLIN